MFYKEEKIAINCVRSSHPKQAKSSAKGYNLKGFDPNEWKRVKLGIMWTCIILKLKYSPSFVNILMATENSYLLELNAYDQFWGAFKIYFQ